MIDKTLLDALDAAVQIAPDAVKLLDSIVAWAQGHPARRVEDVRPAEGHSHTQDAIDDLRGAPANPGPIEPPPRSSR